MTGPVTTEALVGELAKAIHLSLHPGGNFEMARDSQSPGWMAADALAEQIAADFIAPLLAAHQQVTAERDEARADLKAAEDSNDALNEKLSALAPHGSCACSYDKPGDVCMHHSPALATATSELARLRDDVKLLSRAIDMAKAEVAFAQQDEADGSSHASRRVRFRSILDALNGVGDPKTRTALARAATAREG